MGKRNGKRPVQRKGFTVEILRYSQNEQIALTVDNGLVEVWSPAEHSNSRVKVFEKKGKKALLSSDHGLTWKFQHRKAPYCEYYQLWRGEFPYGSWCWAIRKDSITNEVTVTTLETEINPRGETQCDFWNSECRSYVPKSVKADFVVA